MSHSAEFLRGAVAALEKTLGFRSGGVPWVVPMSHQERVSVWDNYRILLVLAEAEARESTPDAAAVIAQCKAALERSVTLLDATHRFVESNDLGEFGVFFDEADCDGSCLADDCQSAEQAGEIALAAVADWEAGR